MSATMRTGRPQGRVRAARTLAATLLAAAGLATLGAATAQASKSQWSIFEDHPSLVTIDDGKRARTLDDIQSLGADTLRVEVKWNEVAPNAYSKKRPSGFDATNPSAYPGFGPYDALVKAAAARGLRILITMTGDAPRWATSRARGGNFKPSAAEYGKFVAVVAARYSGSFSDLPKVLFFTVWNEPNHLQFIKPPSQAPRIYRALVNAAIRAFRANSASGAKIFVGELKPTPRKGFGPERFIQDWLCLDARYKKLRGAAASRKGCGSFKKLDIDGFAHHPYGPIDIVSKTRDIINLLAIRRLGRALDRAARAGRIPRGLPIYNTEFGLQSNPPDIFVNTSPERQAALINQKEEFSYRYSRLKSFSQYQLFDDPSRRGPPAVKWAGFQTGLRFSNGGRKPSYEAYKFPIVVRRSGGGAVIWGRVRPGTGAKFAQLQRKGGGDFSDVGDRIRTNALGYFSVRRPSGTYRFQAYGSPDGSGSAADAELLGTSRVARPSR